MATAAYRAAAERQDERFSRVHDFTNTARVIHSEILLPEGAPTSLTDRATLWNQVDATEKRKDARLAREIEIALPRELTKAQAIGLTRDFVREQFVARGIVADLNVHWGRTTSGEDRPHAHVVLTVREAGPEGCGKTARDWNRTELLAGWRERWVERANERLAELGHHLRIDHRSHAAQDLGPEPLNKIDPAGARREASEEDAERAAAHREFARRNGERIIADPSVVLAALTRQQSTFTRRDLARLVDLHTADADQFTVAIGKAVTSPELVWLGRDGRGQERCTTRELLVTEQQMEQAAVALAERQAHRVNLRRQLRDLTTLGRDQARAYRYVTRMQDLSVVVGYAGTGKSTMLGEARAAWEAAGYQVRGAALSGIAAQQLEGSARIASRTVHSLLFQWGQGREALTAHDVLVVDEAGMIGSRQMERLLSAAQSAGAKVVLVGDPEQLQAMEAGAAFRAIAERVGAVEITEVRRQRAAWQQEATRELATGRTDDALARYEQAGMVQGHATLSGAKDVMIAGWDAARRETPQARQIMLAYRRDDVRDLNLRTRAVRQAAGELGADFSVLTERGVRAFAVGEQVYFLRNERSLGVKNGTLGTVERIAGHVPGEGERLVVRLDAGPVIGFDVKDYAHIDHGYAATVHKSQGVTVDRAHVLATSHMDRHAAYVGLTRHRERVDLHWGADELGSRQRLAHLLRRGRLKDTSLDYGLREETRAESEIRGESAADSVRAYAERRGLVSESAIVGPAGQAAGAPREQSARRRGRFVGLKLNAAPIRPDRVPPAERSWTPAREAELSRAVSQFAKAVEDARRMAREDLPVLPHQQAAMEAGIAAIVAAGPEFDRSDVVNTFSTRAALITPADQGLAGQEVAIAALEETRAQRLALAAQAREAARQWAVLGRRDDQVEQGRERDTARQAVFGMETFVTELKRDPELESLLPQRGREFGIAEGLPLDRVVRGEGWTRELVRDLRLDHGVNAMAPASAWECKR